MKHPIEATRIGRRTFLEGAVLAGGVIPLLTEPVTAGNVDRNTLHVGASVMDITPPLEVGILMSSGRQLWEPFEGVRLPLEARALAVQQNGRRIALVSLDLLGIAGSAVGGWKTFKERVVAASQSAITADDLVLTSTHTHGGPESIALSGLYHTPAFKTWAGDLAKGIGAAVTNASDSLRPCRLMVASQAAPELSVNRRIKTKRGITSVRRKVPAEDLIGPEGPVDDTVRVAAFLDASDGLVAIVVNYTAHPVLEMCIKQVSPDYPGELVRELQRRNSGAVSIFLQGACGNINPPTMERSPENSQRYAHRLADLGHTALSNLKPTEGSALDLRWSTIQLPQRNVHGEPESKPLETKIGAARIGNAAFVFLPGEPFVEIALAIRKASPAEFTAVVGYSEDYIGYIPTDRAFTNGGYEIGPGRWSRCARGSEPVVCREAIQLTRALFRS